MPNIVMVGSREYKHLERVDQRIEAILNEFTVYNPNDPLVFWSGGARGVDEQVKIKCKQLGFDKTGQYREIIPDFVKHKRAYNVADYHKRNKELREMVIHPDDRVVAFWTGDESNSSGTYSMIRYSLQEHRRLEVVFDG